MSNGKRPGGLTALAIIHIVLGGLQIIGVVGSAIVLVLVHSGAFDEVFKKAAEEAAEEAAAEAAAEAGEEELAVDVAVIETDENGVETLTEVEPVAVEEVVRPDEPPEMKELREMLQGPGRWILIMGLLLGFVVFVVEIISGIGYLGQKRVLGRYVGNVYGILALTRVAVLMSTPQPGGANHWMLLSSTVFPVVTLVLINTTFKDDLVH